MEYIHKSKGSKTHFKEEQADAIVWQEEKG
jgi:hypothetical protein